MQAGFKKNIPMPHMVETEEINHHMNDWNSFCSSPE